MSTSNLPILLTPDVIPSTDGSPPIRTHEYFEKRNRRFDIQIEGRFKARPGVEPYRGDSTKDTRVFRGVSLAEPVTPFLDLPGDEIQFGSDFDKLVSFPMTPFKLGLSVARTIDPNSELLPISPASTDVSMRRHI